MTKQVSDQWWRAFFESRDCLDLALFPPDNETDRQIDELEELLDLGADDRIADICCGYGRHLLGLAALGYDVIGLDVSEFLLDCAGLMMAEQDLQARLVRGDAAALPFADESFDVVLNLFNSFGYFLDEGQNVRVLRETARILKPGGRFLLDTRNRKYQILYAPYGQIMSTWDGRELILRCAYDRDTKRLASRWFDPEDEERVVHEASIRLYGLEELRELMSQAGFEELGVYGTYGGEPFSGHHRQLLYAAQRCG